LTVKRQAELLVVNRTSVYRKPAPKLWSDSDLWLMRRIDELHTNEPTWGYRLLTSVLRRESGWIINRKKVRRLMRIMGIYTIFPKPNLSKRFHAQYIRPYLLRKVKIVEPDQVWGIDITYIRMQKGFMYLFVIIDWYSRMIVDYELSSTLEKSFVLACLTRALAKRRPQIINSDQGGHFTNPEYIALLENANVKISMDGKGQCLDNARTERFFRTLKYDRIYIHEYEKPREIRVMLKAYINSYNHYRPHSSIRGKTPAEIYFGNTLEKVSA
jgi:putative transposase